MNKDIVKNKLNKNISSLSLDRDEIKRILKILELRANAAAELEYHEILPKLQPVQIEITKDNLEKCKVLMVTVTSDDGKELIGTIDDVFDSPAFPDHVKSVYVNSEISYRSLYKYFPRNHFEVFLDLSKPNVFDFSFLPGERTPNSSLLHVEGYDSTWANGVFSEVDQLFLRNPSKFPKLHRHGIYDVAVWSLGIPISFWACIIFSPFIEKKLTNNPFIANAVYVYIFFLTLFLVRIIFHYGRWIYPMIEFKSKKSRSAVHQTALYSITIGILGKFIYDIVQWLIQQ